MAKAIPELRNIEKHFGMIIALSGVSIAINEGEVHCLLGDNGAGKSTLIKTMSVCTGRARARSISTGRRYLYQRTRCD